MPYAILRFQKKKMGAVNSACSHNERKKVAYKSNPDIEIGKKDLNYHLVEPTNTYRKMIQHLTMKNQCKTRKDSVYLVETLITATPEFMNALSAEEQREYFTRALAFMEEKVGKENIISAVVHVDEKTPHMHLSFCPITKEKKLSAKNILGNQAQLSNWQTEHHEYMSAKWGELERGISSMITSRKHIPVWLYKQAERLDKQFDAVTNAFNAGKKRDFALKMLEKWLPQAEKFTVQIKTVDKEIKNLKGLVDIKDQTASYWKAESNEDKEKIYNANKEIYRLQNQLEKQARLISSIPPEIFEQLSTNRKKKEMER